MVKTRAFAGTLRLPERRWQVFSPRGNRWKYQTEGGAVTPEWNRENIYRGLCHLTCSVNGALRVEQTK